MNPNEEWKTWQDWLGREPKGRTIYAEVVEMLMFRKIWWAYAIVLKNAPEQARKNGTFASWINWNYGRSLASAIRRQVDVGREIISLGRLMDRIWRFPTVLTRERYLALRDEDDRRGARAWWDANLGPGEFINPEIPAGDMDYLRNETAEVRRWVNRAVAHFGRRPPKAPPLGMIHHGVDVIYELFHKYESVILGVAVAGDVVMTSWPTVFRSAWIPEESWESTMREIDEKTEPEMLFPLSPRRGGAPN